MVRIIDFKTRSNEEGEEFNVLIVQGGVEPVKSKETGKLYFTARKASVPSTFDAETCKTLIGESFEGTIEKVSCEPYEYTIADTGEVIELDYRFEYVDETLDLVEQNTVEAEKVF